MGIKTSDYRCDNKECGHVFEHMVISGALPKKMSCPKCKYSAHRVYSIGAIDVAVGSVGNASTGYEKGIGYHPSKYGKFKGKKIK